MRSPKGDPGREVEGAGVQGDGAVGEGSLSWAQLGWEQPWRDLKPTQQLLLLDRWAPLNRFLYTKIQL